jgi:enamine deaminase RidA (YjgF/YER057c/UK114 family)
MPEASITRQLVIPPGMERNYERLHYAPAIRAGGLLFISGQVGRGLDGKFAEGPAAQIDLALENLGHVLRAAGRDFGDVVEITSFHVGDMAEHGPPFVEAIPRVFPEPYPAWTAVQVSGLAHPRLVVEIKAVAIA